MNSEAAGARAGVGAGARSVAAVRGGGGAGAGTGHRRGGLRSHGGAVPTGPARYRFAGRLRGVPGRGGPGAARRRGGPLTCRSMAASAQAAAPRQRHPATYPAQVLAGRGRARKAQALSVVAGRRAGIAEALRRPAEIVQRQVVFIAGLQHRRGKLRPARRRLELRRLRLQAPPFGEAGVAAGQQGAAGLYLHRRVGRRDRRRLLGAARRRQANHCDAQPAIPLAHSGLPPAQPPGTAPRAYLTARSENPIKTSNARLLRRIDGSIPTMVIFDRTERRALHGRAERARTGAYTDEQLLDAGTAGLQRVRQPGRARRVAAGVADRGAVRGGSDTPPAADRLDRRAAASSGWPGRFSRIAAITTGPSPL